MVHGFVRLQRALLEHALHQRLVLGQLLELAGANVVRPAIADVSQESAFRHTIAATAAAPMPLRLRVRLAGRMHRLAGLIEGRAKLFRRDPARLNLTCQPPARNGVSAASIARIATALASAPPP